LIDPELNRWSLPLTPCIGSQSFGHLVSVQDKAIEHESEVNVGDAPLTEQVLGAWGKERLRCGE